MPSAKTTPPPRKKAPSKKRKVKSSPSSTKKLAIPFKVVVGSKNSASSKTAASSLKASSSSPRLTQTSLFWSLLVLSLVTWYLYRYLFNFPVWFDETIGKALFFGIPVWIYVVATGFKKVADSFSPRRLEKSLLLGLAIGGVYGFVMAILSLIQKGGVVAAAPLFASDAFWFEFGLALFTGFWETLFFFSWIGAAIFYLYKHWSLPTQVIVIAGIFLIFHLPNIILRFAGFNQWPMVLMLGLFALGQTLLFFEYRNAYALILSQAIWGMVLLVHGT